MRIEARSSRASACSSTASRWWRGDSCPTDASIPRRARSVFIREALVPGALATKGAFLAHNQALVAEVAELEHKTRRQDVLVDDAAIADFYAERLPAGIHSRVTFERWREDAERADARLLFMTRESLMRHAASQVTEALFPDVIPMAGASLPLRYRFAPGHPADGLTLTVPLALLNQVDAARLSWLVPGLIREKIVLLLKALPKASRNRLTPLPDAVTAFLEAASPGEAALPDALRTWLAARLREAQPVDVWDALTLPPHLEVNVRVVDAGGKELASGRDLGALRARARRSGAAFVCRRGTRQSSVADCGDGISATLPESLTRVASGQRITGYPALVDDGDAVSHRAARIPARAQMRRRAPASCG